MARKNIQSGTEEFELFKDFWNMYKDNATVEDADEYINTDTSLLVIPCSFRSFLITCDNSLFVMVLFSFRALSHQCR